MIIAANVLMANIFSTLSCCVYRVYYLCLHSLIEPVSVIFFLLLFDNLWQLLPVT